MKKFFTLLLLSLIAWSAAEATYKDGYYNQMDGKKREALKAAAKSCVQKHQTLDYYELPTYWQYSDVYPELYDGCKRWWEMYSNEIYLIRAGQTAKASFSANKMQREHSVPKSWWKKDGSVEYTPAYSDMWNLFPSDGPANQDKSNWPLGPAATATFDNGVTKVGSARNGYGGGASKVFEPADEYKGDFARAYFYVATVYDDINWVVNYMYEANSPWPTLKPWAYQMLLDWARRDPVSQKEIDRNDAVEQSQGNRNPFVDFPELAEYIWGTRTEEVFYIKDQGGTVTPPITGDPELTSPVNGESLDFGQVAVGNTVNAAVIFEGSNLTASLTVRVRGTDMDLFVTEVSSIPAATINTGSRYMLNIAYTPKTTGRHTARLIVSDGGLPDGETVAVELIGEAFPVPQLTALTAYAPQDLTDTGYRITWSEAPEVVDYYEVTRTRYYQDGAESDIYQTGELYFDITDRQPDIMESYTVRSCRLGYYSEPSNSVVVSATSGIMQHLETAPLRVFVEDGTVYIMTESTHTGLRVMDMRGIVVLEKASVENGESIGLDRGVYIITTDQTRRPLKVIVP